MVDFVESFVNLLEAFVNLLKTLIDLLEAAVDPSVQIIEPIAGPAVFHSLHTGSLADRTLRRVKKVLQISNKLRAKHAPPKDRWEAQDGTRTRDPFLTMEVLYQLSYLGGAIDLKASSANNYAAMDPRR